MADTDRKLQPAQPSSILVVHLTSFSAFLDACRCCSFCWKRAPKRPAPGCHDSRYHCKVWFRDWIRGPDGKTNEPTHHGWLLLIGNPCEFVRISSGICGVFNDFDLTRSYWFFAYSLGGMKREAWTGLHTKHGKSLWKMGWKYLELHEHMTLKSTNPKP